MVLTINLVNYIVLVLLAVGAKKLYSEDKVDSENKVLTVEQCKLICRDMGRNKSFTVLYQNTGLGKISNKITQLEILLSYRRPDILFIAESTIDDQTIKLLENVHGYDVEYISEEARIWAAIKKGCVYSRMKDLEVDGLPLIWLKVGTKAKYYVGGFYREWQKLGEVGSLKVREQKLRFNKFLDSWEKVINTGVDYHMLTDMNLDQNKWKQRGGQGSQYQCMVDDLYNKIMIHGATQTVNKTTRHRGTLGSILDLHFTNNLQKLASTSIINDIQSDHSGILIQRKGCGIKGINVVKARSINKINWSIAKSQLYLMKLGHILHIQDPDECTARLTAAVRVVLDSQAKVNTVDVRRKHATWLTDELKKDIETKNQLYKKSLETKKEEDWKEYKILRNKITRQMRKAKKDQISDNLTKLNDQKMWDQAKKHLGWGRPGPPSQIIEDGILLTKQQDVANSMNKTLTEKIDKVKERIPKSNKNPLDYTKKYLENKEIGQFSLGRVTREQVKTVIKKLKNTNAAGPDEIPCVAVKRLSGFLSLYLTHIINLCFEQGKFPTIWKLGKIIPLYKLFGEKDQNGAYLGSCLS